MHILFIEKVSAYDDRYFLVCHSKMENSLIERMMNEFEQAKHVTQEGVEFWLARELQELLGYSKWENFSVVVEKAKQSCKSSKIEVLDHFPDVRKMVGVGSGAEREIDDIMLTRYACYLIAQNGDPRKEKIAFAQTYFAVQTRKYELIEEKLALYERVVARRKLAQTEKELSRTIFQATKTEKHFGMIRSRGDTALFGRSTQAMKKKRKVHESQPLADYMPTILLKAKDFASEITIYNIKEHDLHDERTIGSEHENSNRSVRKTLIQRGITPEHISPSENIK